MRIHKTRITSDNTRHTAQRSTNDPTAWYVTWLPGIRLDRDQAITAMTLVAEYDTLASAVFDDLADTLGLTRVEVAMRLRQQTLL